MSKKIVIIAFDQFTDIDVFLPWDLFNRARLIHPDWSVKILGFSQTHTSVSGIKLEMHGLIEECADADVVFFSSGPGTRKIIRDNSALQRLSLSPSKQIIGSMCSGALILAALGLLDGLTATTYPTSVDLLKSYGIDVVEAPIVIHNSVATAAGCLAALDLVGFMIERLADLKTRESVLASVQPVGKGLECIY
ncbi:MAG TPA: DJ-1/PfpI family protein [Chryseosolibacter sp.]|nr:DJ-1/PfpI family protein [Chryseosolibacter sp.]